jgi:hypothetical protein
MKKTNIFLAILWLLVIGTAVAVSAQTDTLPPHPTLKSQCIATTSKGEQCKRTFPRPAFTDQHEMKCWQHDSRGFKCGAMTTKNTPCKRRVSKKGDRCYNHKP